MFGDAHVGVCAAVAGISIMSMVGFGAVSALNSAAWLLNIEKTRLLLAGPAGYQFSVGAGLACAGRILGNTLARLASGE